MDQRRLLHFIELRDSGRVQDALRELPDLLSTAADAQERASIMLNESACYQLIGRLEDASRCLRAARKLTGRDDIYTNYVGADLLIDEGKYAEAAAALQRLRGDHAAELARPEERDLRDKVLVKLGILLAQLQRDREALPLLQQALSLQLDDPTRGSVCYNLGLCHFTLGNKAEAKKLFLEAVDKASPDYSVLARYYLGIVYGQEGAYARALQEFLEVESHAGVATSITADKIHGYLAMVYRALGRPEEAKIHARLAGSG